MNKKRRKPPIARIACGIAIALFAYAAIRESEKVTRWPRPRSTRRCTSTTGTASTTSPGFPAAASTSW